MNQAGIEKPYFSNRLSSSSRIELDCPSCGGRVSLDSASSKKMSCPFCGSSGLERKAMYFKQEVAIAGNDSTLGSHDEWRARYQKQKRWWMRRRFCEKKIEELMDLLLTGNGRVLAVTLGMAVVGGVLAFVIGIS